MKWTGAVSTTERIKTGFFSFDRALGDAKHNIGLPSKACILIYGKTSIGKSTFAWTLASKINPQGKIAFADLEGFSEEYMETVLSNQGFDGEVEVITSDEDETALDNLNKAVLQGGAQVAILDSVGALSPIAEREGDVGDAVWGKRAKAMNQFARKATFAIRMAKQPTLYFLTNHVHPIMTLGAGVQLPGGEGQKFLASIHLHLKKKLEITEDGGYLIEGKVEKNRFGYWNRLFHIYYLAGWGIHPGLTAVYDCIKLGLAKKDRTISLNGKSYGYGSKLLDKVDDPEYFEPFTQALEQISNINFSESKEDEDDVEEDDIDT